MKLNIKLFRSVHLYLGCFFAPLLTVFILTGVVQTFELHESKKSGYVAPAILESLAQVHQHQRYATDDVRPKPSDLFRWFVAVMAVGLFVNISLGIMMAFKFAEPKAVMVAVVLGIVIPIIILSVQWWHKL